MSGRHMPMLQSNHKKLHHFKADNYLDASDSKQFFIKRKF